MEYTCFSASEWRSQIASPTTTGNRSHPLESIDLWEICQWAERRAAARRPGGENGEEATLHAAGGIRKMISLTLLLGWRFTATEAPAPPVIETACKVPTERTASGGHLGAVSKAIGSFPKRSLRLVSQSLSVRDSVINQIFKSNSVLETSRVQTLNNYLLTLLLKKIKTALTANC